MACYLTPRGFAVQHTYLSSRRCLSFDQAVSRFGVRSLARGCLSLGHAVSRRSAGPEVAPRSAAPFGVSICSARFWGKFRNSPAAQTSKFLIPKSCALRARRPDRGATPRPALHREYGFSWFICGEGTLGYFGSLFLECFGPLTQVKPAQTAMQLIALAF